MSQLSELVAERTDLGAAELDRLREVIAEWSLVADLAMSDLVLWVPTWNDGGMIAVALVRPTTAPTNVPEDIIGSFAPRGSEPDQDAALRLGRPSEAAFPVHFGDRVIAVVVRHSAAQPRVAGQLEGIYARCAHDLLDMLVAGTFPDPAEPTVDSPRVGDGLIRCHGDGTVEYASPNAVSALHRLGIATNIVGSELRALLSRLAQRTGPLADDIDRVISGRRSGMVELENRAAIVQVRGLPLIAEGESLGTLVLLRDITDLRRRERALVSKDATIREIHHRVKNNLQMVAALLRLQSRRATGEEVKSALDEAQVRVGAIAIVHECLSMDIADAVAFDDVLDRILAMVAALAPAYAADGAVPTISHSGASVMLPSEIATPLAMCISELVQNAVEHARAHHISVSLSRDSSLLTAIVDDDGIGLPLPFDLATAGLGMQIVDTMATGELHGSFEITARDAGGTRAVVRANCP